MYLLLLAGLVASLFVALLQLPGLWLMLLLAGGYIWATGGVHMGLLPLVIMLILAVIAEIAETLASAHGARRAGASRTAMVLSVVGALVGGLFLTIIPIPIVGTLVGVCVGAFMGAAIGELIRGRQAHQIVKSGIGATVGRLLGTLLKLMFGAIMLLIAAITALPTQPKPAAAPAPATATIPQVER